MLEASDNELLLEMIALSKAFPGVQALDDVSFSLRRGTVHALVGENGAGKSTLMKCLFGVYKKDTGRILINGEEVDITSPHDAFNAWHFHGSSRAGTGSWTQYYG